MPHCHSPRHPKVFKRKVSETKTEKVYKFINPKTNKWAEIPFSALINPELPCPEKYKQKREEFFCQWLDRYVYNNDEKDRGFTRDLISKYYEIQDGKRLLLYSTKPGAEPYNFEWDDFESYHLIWEDQNYIQREEIYKYALNRDIENLSKLCFKIFKLNEKHYELEYTNVCVDSKNPEGSFLLRFMNKKNKKDILEIQAYITGNM